MPLVREINVYRGKQLRRARRAAGFTQVTLAERVDVEQNTISRFETGAVCPSELMQLKLAVVLGCDVDELFGWPFGTMDMARTRLADLIEDEEAA